MSAERWKKKTIRKRLDQQMGENIWSINSKQKHMSIGEWMKKRSETFRSADEKEVSAKKCQQSTW